MKITINGQEKKFNENLNVSRLVEKFCSSTQNVIAEINGDIVKKDQWNNRLISEGDEIELVNFVGGG